jgi:hypothetical protein
MCLVIPKPKRKEKLCNSKVIVGASKLLRSVSQAYFSVQV